MSYLHLDINFVTPEKAVKQTMNKRIQTKYCKLPVKNIEQYIGETNGETTQITHTQSVVRQQNTLLVIIISHNNITYRHK